MRYVVGSSFVGDYMAVPSVRRMHRQSADILAWLQKAQAAGRPLEDWLETKIAQTSHDVDSMHNFVVDSDIARMGLGRYVVGARRR